MSYATAKAIFPNEKVGDDLKQYSNAWGTAPHVWDALARQYMGLTYNPIADKGAMERVWELWKHLGIPQYKRAVLFMTFDRAFVARRDYARAAADIRKYLADHQVPEGHINHWPAIAELFESNPDVPAIGFWMTSVSEDAWHGAWDEEKEEYGPVDWSDTHDIYAELDAIERPVKVNAEGK